MPSGSSPRMRGTPSNRHRWRGVTGIIPAYAGNTQYVMRRYLLTRDHPRVCGEHDPPVNGSDSFVGSSPRMRGTPYTVGALGWATGIIPAYAGNTNHAGSRSVFVGDHPRVCGEHMLRERTVVGQAGSSPRMRGTHRYQGWRKDGGGIIPAYAGNTA